MIYAYMSTYINIYIYDIHAHTHTCTCTRTHARIGMTSTLAADMLHELDRSPT